MPRGSMKSSFSGGCGVVHEQEELREESTYSAVLTKSYQRINASFKYLRPFDIHKSAKELKTLCYKRKGVD
jgi:hypothetical protein